MNNKKEVSNGWTHVWPETKGVYWFYGNPIYGYGKASAALPNKLFTIFADPDKDTYIYFDTDDTKARHTNPYIAVGLWRNLEVPEPPEF